MLNLLMSIRGVSAIYPAYYWWLWGEGGGNRDPQIKYDEAIIWLNGGFPYCLERKCHLLNKILWVLNGHFWDTPNEPGLDRRFTSREVASPSCLAALSVITGDLGGCVRNRGCRLVGAEKNWPRHQRDFVLHVVNSKTFREYCDFSFKNISETSHLSIWWMDLKKTICV